MHLFHITQCTIRNRNVLILLLNGALLDMGQVLCGICYLAKLWRMIYVGNNFVVPHLWCYTVVSFPLHWRHNDHDGVSNHQPHGCLLNRLFGRTSKKISKLRVTVLGAGNSPGPVNSPHKGPVTRKMFPFDDVTMSETNSSAAFEHSCVSNGSEQ